MESVSGFICVLLKAVSTVAMPTVCCIPTDYFHLRFHPIIVGVSRGYTDHHQGRAIHMADSRID